MREKPALRLPGEPATSAACTASASAIPWLAGANEAQRSGRRARRGEATSNSATRSMRARSTRLQITMRRDVSLRQNMRISVRPSGSCVPSLNPLASSRPNGTFHLCGQSDAPAPQSHAAPRAPLESPCTLRTSRVDTVRKYPRPPMPRHIRVEALDVRHAPAEHDHVRIEQIDHVRERPRQSLLVTLERRQARGVTAHRTPRDVGRRHAVARHVHVVAFHARAGQPGLDAARSPAEARGAGTLVIFRPRQGVVAPFAGDRVRAVEHASVHDTRPTPVPRMAPRPPSPGRRARLGSAKQLASLVTRTSAQPRSRSRGAGR